MGRRHDRVPGGLLLRMKTISYRIFLFVLIFSPLAFGTVETWSYAIMEIMSFLAVVLFLVSISVEKGGLYEVPGIIPLFLLLLYAGIQLLPLPGGLVNSISPNTYSLYHETLGGFEPLGWIPLTIHKKATLTEFFRLSTYVFFYLLTVQLLSVPELLKKTVKIIVIFATLLSVLAMLQYFSYSLGLEKIAWEKHKIFWFRELTQGGNPFGPYVNRNHYAGFMGMIFPISLTLFFVHKPRVEYQQSIRKKIVQLFDQQSINLHLLFAFSTVLIASSIFLTMSRGGIVSVIISLGFFCLFLFIKEQGKGRWFFLFSILVLILLAVDWFSWQPILERFQDTKRMLDNVANDFRFFYLKDSINIIHDFFITGTGLGTFKDIYPSYRTLPGIAVIDHAHNDYIELLVDGGIVSLILVSCFLVSLLVKTWKKYRKRNDKYSIYLYIGTLAAILSMLIHGFSDFNFHIGANGLFFFFLCGLAVSGANTRLRKRLIPTYLKKIDFPKQRYLVVPVSVLAMAVLVFNLGVEKARSYSSSRSISDHASPSDPLFFRSRLQQASRFDPLDAGYHYALAQTEITQKNLYSGLFHLKSAVQLNPVSAEYLQGLGLLLAGQGEFDAADNLLKAGIRREVNNPIRYQRYVSWLLSAGRKERARENMREAISLFPGKSGVEAYLTLMVRNGFSEEEIWGTVPQKTEPLLIYAKYLENIGQTTKAEEIYQDALEVLSENDRRSSFVDIYNYYIKKNCYNEALRVMYKQLALLPDIAKTRITIAGLYEKLGITYRAIEEYRQALVLEPNNQTAKRGFERLVPK